MKFFLFGFRKKKNNKKSTGNRFSNKTDDELSDIEYIKNLIEEEKEKKKKNLIDYNIYRRDHMEIFNGISIRNYNPLESIILNHPSNVLFNHSDNRRPLKREEILHNYITGENNRNLIDSPTIATELENSKLANEISAGHFCSKFDKSDLKQSEQIQGANFENTISNEKIENEYNNEKQSFSVLNLNDCNENSIQSGLPTIVYDSKLDILTDLESFVSNDQKIFEDISAKKFKSLCMKSNHCWEENGKLPNII